ncbi:AAA family ATPase [Candidatus Gracilibacteria bacterium]|nr:AAA family ATPase [Candidatus Gracilibacteria bacterium]MCF7819705.1 AAA family ATPase [Candidatus Gracilibacteria bacterium]
MSEDNDPSPPRISKLFIRNFRSFGPEGVEINFDTNMTALVGHNNVGKSNILAALDIILGSSWWGENTFSLEDFYQKNPAKDILIQAFFDSKIEHEIPILGDLKYPVKVFGFQIEYKQYKNNSHGHTAGELHLEYACINSKGNPVKYPSSPPKKGKQLVLDRTLTISKKMRERVNGIYIPINRDVLSQSPSNPKTLLGALVKNAREEFLNDDTQTLLSEEEKKVLKVQSDTLGRKEIFEKFIERANEVIKSGELITITKKIHTILLEHLGERESQGVELDFGVQEISDQYKYLKLSLTKDELALPINRLGSGFQSLIVIAIFRTYLELQGKDAIFLIEEPEMFLHPHAKKNFYEILKAMADKGAQVIYTTHATEFVRLRDYENVKRVIIDKKKTKIFPENETIELDFSEDKLLKFSLSVNNERAELFFAEKVLLVEGNTEKLVFEYILRNLYEFEPNKYNVSIVETSGKGDMPKYVKLLKSFQIPFVCVYDSDLLDQEPDDSEAKKKFNKQNKDAEGKNKILEECANEEERHIFSPYFELEVGMEKRRDKKQESKPIKGLEFFSEIKNKEELEKKFPTVVLPLKQLLGENFWQKKDIPKTLLEQKEEESSPSENPPEDDSPLTLF